MKKILVSLVAMMFLFAPMAFGLSIGDDNYIGSFIPSNQNEEGEANSINILLEGVQPPQTVDGITYYPFASFDFSLTYPEATHVGSFKDEDENNSGNFGSGWTYLLGKYATFAHVWYVAGLTGDFSIPSDTPRITGSQGQGNAGLSHYTLFNPTQKVPEPSTLLLFGAGIAGLAMYRRKRS